MATIVKRDTKDGIAYQAKVRLKGYPPQSACFQRLTDAKKWAQDVESAIRDGRHFKTAESKRHTVADLIDRYIRDVLPTKPKQQYKQTQQLTWWKLKLGHHLLSDLSPALISECRDELLRTPTNRGGNMSPASVVRYLAALSHALSVAVNEWQWLDDSPARKVKKPKEPRGRVRFLSDDERERLLKACLESSNKSLYAVVVLALSSGMRRGEILNIKWKDIDLSQGFLILHETKNGERRRVPVSGHALDTLKEYSKVRQLHTELVFPGKTGKPAEIRKPWLLALKQADIEDFRFHDLRHSCASYLAMGGASMVEISEVLGHRTLQMAKRYSHLSDSHVSNVVASMNERLFR